MKNITIHVLQGTGKLTPFVEKLNQLSNEALEKITQAIPVKDVDIIFKDDPFFAIKEIGIGGYAPNAHVVYISLDPDVPNLQTKLTEHLGRQLAHELHHALRWHNPGYGETLLEALISEGLADMFSYEVFPGELEKWDVALTADELEKHGKFARNAYDNPYNHDEWFFGTNSEMIPKWAGYTLGYNLVKEYLNKHPEKTAATSYALEAKTLVGK